jgi:hypothetical protein
MMKMLDNPSAEFKAEWQKVTDGVAGINSRLPVMEQEIATLRE